VLLGGPAAPAVADQAPPPEQTPAAAPEPLRILPLGDSLTWGKGSSDASGYRAVLHRALATAGLDVDFVGSQRNGRGPDTEHEGHPGWRIDEVDAHAEQWVPAADPDVVLLDLGTNDYVQRYDTRHAAARLAALVDWIHALAPGAHIVLARLLVIDGDQRAAGVRQLNAAIPRIAAARRGFVTVADMSRISVANTVDGVHPGDLGYRQMAYQWYQALRRVLPGGASWPAMADPFPVPAVRVSVSARDARVALTGRLTSVDLGNVTVRLRYRRAGAATWVGLGTARTDRTGVAHFRARTGRPGSYAAVGGGRRGAGPGRPPPPRARRMAKWRRGGPRGRPPPRPAGGGGALGGAPRAGPAPARRGGGPGGGAGGPTPTARG